MLSTYLRVSTGHHHLKNQEGEIRHYVEPRGIVINRWGTETVSGKTKRKEPCTVTNSLPITLLSLHCSLIISYLY